MLVSHIEERNMSNLIILEGDIIMEEEDELLGYQNRHQEMETHIWPNRTVFYTFSVTLSESFIYV